MPSFDGVILIAHGARDARWHSPFIRMRADLMEILRPRKVALAFMEFAKPTLAEAAAEICAAGIRSVLVVPVFLSGGGHVANDIPAMVEAERARFPGVTFTISGALGEEVEVAAAMAAAVTRLVNDA